LARRAGYRPPGRDHIVLTDVDVVDRNLPVTIDETLVLEPITF
jgi:hypothetical protein